ncbi:MAG TPA: terminase large subunit, partial [Candidatus Binatia bacterium]|nr:terminase large subunit [Candidatus Binatia bacterium]
MTILEAMADPNLFQPLFRSPESWRAWTVWLKAVFALPMAAAERALYHRCTGRQHPPTTEPTEVFTICGRRSGKSFVASLTAVFLATFRDYTPFLSPGERAVVMVLARDRNQAGVIFRYIAGILRTSPLLEQMIEAERAEEIDLSNRVTIAVYTSSYKAIRGVTIAAALCDEIAFWQSEGVNP